MYEYIITRQDGTYPPPPGQNALLRSDNDNIERRATGTGVSSWAETEAELWLLYRARDIVIVLGRSN